MAAYRVRMTWPTPSAPVAGGSLLLGFAVVLVAAALSALVVARADRRMPGFPAGTSRPRAAAWSGTQGRLGDGSG